MTKLLAAAIKLTPLEFKENLKSSVVVCEAAIKQSASIVCFPELSISGYNCEDAFYYQSTLDCSLESIKSLINLVDPKLHIFVGAPFKFEDKLYNCIFYIHHKEIKAIIPKQYLANDGVHYEARWFTPWQSKSNGKVLIPYLQSNPVEIGPQILEIEKFNIAIEICEDAWVENRPVKFYTSQKKIDLVLNPSASHFAFGKHLIRQKLTAEGSKIINGKSIFINQLGNESGRTIYDGDIIYCEKGELKFYSERLSFKEYNLKIFDLSSQEKDTNLISESSSKEEIYFYDFTKAVSLGLYDYFAKTKSKSFIISLSGGADSATVAVLVHCMCYYLVKEYGINKAAFKLGITETVTSVREIVSKILTCVYQSTENSSEITLNAAKVVAEKIGANFYSISIDEINKKYISSFSNLICKNPSWSDSDISLQNIQARVRSPGIWFLANLTNSLLLTTGNRSESAVGYTTMDGDSSGSLAPIAGVSKTFILNWLKWLQRGNLRDIMDFAWLEVITSQSPTAELRPLSSHQTDEKDLMPYPVLEYLEESFLLNRLSKEQVVEDIKNKFPTTDFNDLVKYIDKFLLLWKTSQWKRERLAPSFHLDTFSVDSRSWLRFPILSGGIN